MRKSLLSLIGLVSAILLSTGASAADVYEEGYCYADNMHHAYNCCTDHINHNHNEIHMPESAVRYAMLGYTVMTTSEFSDVYLVDPNGYAINTNEEILTEGQVALVEFFLFMKSTAVFEERYEYEAMERIWCCGWWNYLARPVGNPVRMWSHQVLLCSAFMCIEADWFTCVVSYQLYRIDRVQQCTGIIISPGAGGYFQGDGQHSLAGRY